MRWAAGLALAILSTTGAAIAADTTNFRLLTLDGNRVAWPIPVDEPRVSLTWALVKENVDLSGARNCRRMQPVDKLTAASAVTIAAFRRELSRALALWQQVAAVNFREAGDTEKADILIGAQAEPEGWAYADVFFDKAAPGAVKPITRGLVCLNPAQRWKVGFDGNLTSYDLRYTLAHEIGHTLGLDHPSRSGQVMSYRYDEKVSVLQSGDVAGAVKLYGLGSSGQHVTVVPETAIPAPPSATVRATTMGLR